MVSNSLLSAGFRRIFGCGDRVFTEKGKTVFVHVGRKGLASQQTRELRCSHVGVLRFEHAPLRWFKALEFLLPEMDNTRGSSLLLNSVSLPSARPSYA